MAGSFAAAIIRLILLLYTGPVALNWEFPLVVVALFFHMLVRVLVAAIYFTTVPTLICLMVYSSVLPRYEFTSRRSFRIFAIGFVTLLLSIWLIPVLNVSTNLNLQIADVLSVLVGSIVGIQYLSGDRIGV